MARGERVLKQGERVRWVDGTERLITLLPEEYRTPFAEGTILHELAQQRHGDSRHVHREGHERQARTLQAARERGQRSRIQRRVEDDLRARGTEMLFLTARDQQPLRLQLRELPQLKLP
jgi:hypothetical protein